jgi:centromeric protein E
VEIYNEVVRDLLDDGSPTISIREDRVRGPYAQCAEVLITTPAEMMDLLHRGESSRVVGETDMNKRSSRSHTIFTVTVKSTAAAGEAPGAGAGRVSVGSEVVGGDGAVEDAVLVGKLNIVDLAGSESVRTTGASGERLKEAGKINTSLLALARVIEALGSGANSHISFRDSKLTRILQPSLTGNTRTSVICCVSPAQQFMEETRSALMFASRAKNITTSCSVNEVISDEVKVCEWVGVNAHVCVCVSVRVCVRALGRCCPSPLQVPTEVLGACARPALHSEKVPPPPPPPFPCLPLRRAVPPPDAAAGKEAGGRAGRAGSV